MVIDSEKLAQILGSLPQAVLLVDHSGVLRWVNEAAARSFAWPREQLLKQTLGSLFPRLSKGQGDPRAVLEAIKAQPHERLWGRQSHGREVPLKPHWSTLEDEQLTVLTLTAQATEAVDYRELFERAAMAMIVFDQNLRYVAINDMAEGLYGYKREQLLGQSLAVLVPEELKEAYLETAKVLLENPSEDITVGEFTALRENGQPFPVEAYAGRVRLEGGTLGSVIVQDISVRKRVEKALAEARAEADSANHAKSQFLASMSHELKTPLNGILGYAQILLRDEELKARQQQSLVSIRSCGEHLLHLVNDILDLSKIDSGHLEIQLQLCELSEILNDVIQIVEGRALEKGLELKLVTLSRLPHRISTDSTRLRQILINLLSNAIKYTQTGKVTLEALASRRILTLKVRDTGAGIPEDHQESIFDPFSQIGDSTRERGTGLGLAISQRLALALGGRLTVTSQEGRGSSFALTLPLRDGAGLNVESRLFKPGRQYRLAPGQSARVLIVDDTSSNRTLLDFFLTAAGLQTSLAVNGEHALKVIAEDRPDLVFMDLKMPVMDGLEATERLRAKPETKDLIVIAVSVSLAQKTQDMAKQVGCDGILEKPIQFDRLFECLTEHLNLHFVELGTDTEAVNDVKSADDFIKYISAELKERLGRAIEIGDIGAITEICQQLREEWGENAWLKESREACVSFDFDKLARLYARLGSES